MIFLDSGIQSVGDSIRGSSDSMSNATSSNGANVEQEPVEVVPASVPSSFEPLKQNIPSAAKSIVSIEQKVFGGKIQTTYECCQCHTVSIHTEFFNDLLLPFPADVPTTETEQSTQTKKTLTMQVRKPQLPK